jgi:hypothetical protein
LYVKRTLVRNTAPDQRHPTMHERHCRIKRYD